MFIAGLILSIVVIAGGVAYATMIATHNKDVKSDLAYEVRAKHITEEEGDTAYNNVRKEVSSGIKIGAGVSLLVALVLMLFSSIFFYADPSYWYHVKQINGTEKIVDKTGYAMYLFGTYEPWKKAVTAQADKDPANRATRNLKPIELTFLDQVDASSESTVRFLMPTSEKIRLKLAHDYRTQANFMDTSLVPAYKETLQATANLMTAETYYAGGRTEFNNTFEEQMKHGVYVVTRIEKEVPVTPQQGTANASLGVNQKDYGDTTKKVFKVKIKENNGQRIRKDQAFSNFGVKVVEARITFMDPNTDFKTRMKSKQRASADRAIAKERRTQEVEQKLLAVAKGKREIAEQQAATLVLQIQATTAAETEKQLALTKASKLLEQEQIRKKQAQISYERAQIAAEETIVTADAEAHARKAKIEADNALQMKLDAEIKIQSVWAEAFAKRSVPTTVFGGASGTPTGSDSEVSNFMNLMTMRAAKGLNYDRSIEAGKSVVK